MQKKLTALLAVLVTGAVCLWAFPSVDAVLDTITWLQHAGPIGLAVFVVLYGAATVAMVPASWGHGTAGFLYGPLFGPGLALFLALGFSSLNFWLGRTLFRTWVEEKLLSHPRFAAIDALIGERGLMLMILLRISPLSPFNPLSYAMGATRVRFRDFFVGTLVGGALPVFVWSSLGASVTDIGALIAGEAAGPGWLQTFGLVVTVIASLVATHFAKQALDRAMAVDTDEPVEIPHA